MKLKNERKKGRLEKKKKCPEQSKREEAKN